jgi:hypothetical protein
MAKYKFKLLVGQHAEHGRVYKAGDIIETDYDLNRFNAPKAEKFQRITGEEAQAITQSQAAQAPVDETLESMTLQELRNLAAEEELDLGNAKTKAEIIAAIRGTISKA